MADYLIREARASDAQEILNIYRFFVQDTAISFEYSVPSVEDFKKRIEETLKKFPYLVAEIDNKIVGYAYADTLRSRAAYSWSVEATVYIAQDFQRRGLGRALYSKLFKVLKQQGVANIFAGVVVPNDASVGLHKSLGFKQIGIYKNIGWKFEKWWDVAWLQLELQKIEKPAAIKKYKI